MVNPGAVWYCERMKRAILQSLVRWKDSSPRKPLILRGARQVGKTWVLREFGRRHYHDEGRGFHYFDFQRHQRELALVFETSRDPRRVVRELSLLSGASIQPGDLIVFDEVQNCPEAVESLKFFAQEIPEQAIICAGSHLHLLQSIQGFSFPVGKVTFLDMYPMTFSEFVRAVDPALSENIDAWTRDEPFLQTAHQRALDLICEYQMTGGLPEAVAAWCGTREAVVEGASRVEQILNDLILGYESDFAKYSGRHNADSIRRVFRAAASQLHTEQDGTTRKFIFSELPSNLNRYERMRGPLDWLESSQLLTRVHICHEPNTPLAHYANENRFKLFYFDVGVLLRTLQIPARIILQQRIGTYRGYILENFVAQELRAHLGTELYSWVGATSEVEFLVQRDEAVIPVEVKSSARSRRARSLQAYMQKYSPPLAVKATGQNYGRSGPLVTLPLYALQYLKQI